MVKKVFSNPRFTGSRLGFKKDAWSCCVQDFVKWVVVILSDSTVSDMGSRFETVFGSEGVDSTVRPPRPSSKVRWVAVLLFSDSRPPRPPSKLRLAF
ncbi:hypothetical protein SUGI_1081230 [Cryptomeria japonica]|nr:hypothetical protein SUGI_1081230 [Cryptomeria japonica]